ncbi:DUF599 domain-containing protein [Paragemmobacter straminiformis]|uniref:DUF599 domain-containing protein n=1 Tax=Paragemmobacter straminiformis TaxID=2045119 RepID=A0A842I5C0_9RHOB|nr:DUF599 domain-containing protein [Gemmobacter straminiformis]MBC2834178.1 DUF599 domain-containing protein [Gemmobacter straminiformis]
MDSMLHLGPFTILDGIGLAVLMALFFASGWLSEHPPANRPSVSVLMERHRRDWMVEFVTRQPRIFDATILDSLRQGTAFFASASMIAIGGGVALIGNTQRLESLASDLSLQAVAVLLEVKIILILAFLANALLKFIWAHRLFGYCSILMAAVPNDITNPAALPRAAQAGEINITAARSFNRGLRSIYFALAALGWLLGPWVLVVTSVAAAGVLLRREFWSHSRQVMLGL